MNNTIFQDEELKIVVVKAYISLHDKKLFKMKADAKNMSFSAYIHYCLKKVDKIKNNTKSKQENFLDQIDEKLNELERKLNKEIDRILKKRIEEKNTIKSGTKVVLNLPDLKPPAKLPSNTPIKNNIPKPLRPPMLIQKESREK